MNKGGKNQLTAEVKLFRYIGLLVPVVLVAHGLLTRFVVPRDSFELVDYIFVIMSFWWIYVGFLQFFVRPKSELDVNLRLMSYHLLAGSYLVFFVGFSSPFVVMWLVLLLISYIYKSKKGYFLSASALLATASVDIFLHWRVQNIVISDLIMLIVILVTSFVFVTVLSLKTTEKSKSVKHKANDDLQRDRVLTIINNLTDAVISTDPKGIVNIYNSASLALLDTNISPIGRHIDDLIPLKDVEGNDFSVFKELLQIKSVVKRDDLNYSYDSNDKIRLEMTFSPIRSGFDPTKKSESNDGFVIILRDITKQKSLEEERDEFVSVISHELRTPITIAEGTISNVQVMMQHPNATQKMLADAINTAHDQVIFLASMVNDLSTLSRAERGVADNTELIDLRELANAMHDKYQSDAKAKKIHLNLDLSAKLDNVNVSRLYLEELLQNLITNAIKYTKSGSVTISIHQKGPTVTFAVKDTGIGISKSDQSKIFAKFYRSEDYRTRENSGTGLGLYIGAKLAHKLGTKVECVSRLNFGSTFSFNLPISNNKN